jgi:hypothetical protein
VTLSGVEGERAREKNRKNQVNKSLYNTGIHPDPRNSNLAFIKADGHVRPGIPRAFMDAAAVGKLFSVFDIFIAMR